MGLLHEKIKVLQKALNAVDSRSRSADAILKEAPLIFMILYQMFSDINQDGLLIRFRFLSCNQQCIQVCIPHNTRDPGP